MSRAKSALLRRDILHFHYATNTQLLLEVIEKKDLVRFSNPIVYDSRLAQRILSLSHAILGEKDEALCSELLLSLERAKQLLERNKDIDSAVAACGFVDLTHLNKHFKSVYGTTAYEYLSHLN
jgi:hypothetical protein